MDQPALAQTPKCKPAAFKIWLALMLTEGAVAAILLFARPSEAGRSLLLGYSLARLVLGLAAILTLIALGWAARRARKDTAWLMHLCRRLDDHLLTRDHLLSAFLAALFITLFLIGFTLVFSTRLSYRLQDILFTYPAWMLYAVDLLRAAFQRAAPLILWTAAAGIQTLALLACSYAAAFSQKWRDGSIFKALALLLMTALSLFHWTVLVFNLKTFMAIPGWKWYITPKEIYPHQYGLFLVFFFLTLLVIHFVLSRPKLPRNIFILIALGYSLQVSFGFIAGGGFETIRLKYADSVFNGYAWAAAEQPPLYPALYNFETLYGQDRYLGTKPPGILIPYAAAEKAASLLSPSQTVEERFYKLTKLAAYTYPLAAFLVLGVLFWFSRRLFKDSQDALLPALVYILCPNVILIPVFLDQVLYPLFFLLVLSAALLALKRPSFLGGFLLGAAGYTVLYFSFSLLALLPFVMLWAGMEWLRQPAAPRLRQTILLLLGILAGAAAFALFFRVFLNYDIVARYLSAFANHRTTWHFDTWGERIRHALLLNNAEFATWTGFPLILLLLVRLVQAARAFLRRQASRLDALALTFLVIYLLLVTLGQTNGEAQRLYLFFTPLVALFSADALRSLFKEKRSALLFIAALQLITIVLLFQLQDFYG
ncbi:MAG: hypothetical protein IT308_02510 [Anaerolineaceae bacterium]|nr:hypothetical protein [Anaerolineaceae bacterium]